MIQPLTQEYAYKILSLTRRSFQTIDALSYVMSFNRNSRSDKANLIYTALADFQAGPGDVRFIIDRPKIHKPNYHPNKFAIRRLKDVSIRVRCLNSGDTQHAKLFIFDHKFAVVGSHNLTPASLRNRFDISLLVDEPDLLTFFTTYFNDLWSSAIGV